LTTAFEIPLVPQPQMFEIVLAGVQYQLLVWWNNVNQSWMIDISDSSGNPIVTGIPLVTGQDLLAPYGYLNFGGQLIAQTDFKPGAVPTFKNLGTTGHLYWITSN